MGTLFHPAGDENAAAKLCCRPRLGLTVNDHHPTSLVREVAHRRTGDVTIRAWVPGCGDGLSAFVLAAAFADVLGEEDLLSRVHVCGTDVDRELLETARSAQYPVERLADLPPAVVERYFEPDGDHRRFRDDLRAAVSFARNDLREDRPLRRLDLIDAADVPLTVDGRPTDESVRVTSCLRPGAVLRAPADFDSAASPVPLQPVGDDGGLWERPVPERSPDFGSAWRPDQPIRVVVVNEHELFVRGLGVLLESMFGRFLTVVAVSHDPSEVVPLVAAERPDLVIVDVTGPASADLPSKLREVDPNLPVLALAEDPHEAWREVVAGGAAGVVPRSASADELVGPLLAVAEGLAVLPPEAVRVLGRGVGPDGLELLDQLTEEELQLWAWVARGMQDNEIAGELFVSPRTVKRRIGALLRTLGVGRRVEAAELAGRLGLLARYEEHAPVEAG